MASGAHDQLTTQIVSPSDLKRTRRDLEQLDDELHQASLRSAGKDLKLPPQSRLIEELTAETGLNLLKADDRAKLMKYVDDLIVHAPVLHVSFASEPSAAFMQKLIIWLRANIHPQTLVHLGLQPSIAAGCVVRTANKQFDFSLAQSFEKQSSLLLESLRFDPNAATPQQAKDIEAATLQAALAAATAQEPEKVAA